MEILSVRDLLIGNNMIYNILYVPTWISYKIPIRDAEDLMLRKKVSLFLEHIKTMF
jgi:hypothetical protein